MNYRLLEIVGLITLGLLIGLLWGTSLGMDKVHREAAREGLAHYIVNKNGRPQFEWTKEKP